MTSKYTNSTPNSTRIQYPVPEGASPDFLMFVNQYIPQEIVNIEDVPAEHVAFFSEVIKNLYHLVYVPKTEHTDTAYGSGNYQLIKLNRDDGTYYLELYGIRSPRYVYSINDANVVYGTNSITFSSGNGLNLTIAKSGDIFDFGNVTLAELWQITLKNTYNNNLIFRYQTVKLTM